MNTFDIEKLVRPNVREMAPYSSARDEFKGEAQIYLDANENSLGSVSSELFNRYPDPTQNKLRTKVARLKGVEPEQIFFGNGSDEPIDLLLRAFCQPQKDRVLIFPPTYGMYKVQANINDTPVEEISLNEDFSLPLEKIQEVVNPQIKLMFICSPNNPSGNLISKLGIIDILKCFKGLVVVDEAYIDFAPVNVSMISEINTYPNLVVLQTFSKAWGLAGLRLGMAFAQKPIIDILNKIKYPYNINTLTQQHVLEALNGIDKKEQMVATLLQERTWLNEELKKLKAVKTIYPSDANFLLVRMEQANLFYKKLTQSGIIVRNRSNVALCDNCLRITVGTPNENQALIKQMQGISLKLLVKNEL
ncbi:MAG: histidinol-phosphate transaminase [Bacteroidetes bacterium HGW-Bacteroidetes-4]|jgi:histidinol-phosphate aminotransferase|nr:MAG: histidinol-phosphate transaminase [Bacteroidetes bacterium HGW-Bacteroidetes-4]